MVTYGERGREPSGEREEGRRRTGYCRKIVGEPKYLDSFPPFEKEGNFSFLIQSINAIEHISMGSLINYLPTYLSTYQFVA